MKALALVAADSDPSTDRVRCLECGYVYAKPAGRSTVASNPGCPNCGYIGWVDAALPVTPAMLRNRSAAGLQRTRPGRRR